MTSHCHWLNWFRAKNFLFSLERPIMRKPIFLLLVVVLASTTLVHADGVDDEVANRLAKDARSNKSPEVRLAALQALTELGAKASAAIPELRNFLRDGKLLNDLKEQKDLFVFQTAQALAAMGEKARSAIPELTEAQQEVSDPKAKKALVTAIVAITLASQAPQNPPPASPSSLTIDQLLQNLKNNDPNVRREAAKALNKRAGDIATALPKLVDATRDNDAQTAAAARKTVEEMILVTQKWTQSYILLRVADLSNQDPAARDQAAKDLGALGKIAASALPFLQDRLKSVRKK